MSTICLICKDKLLNSAPGSSLGSLNSLVENNVIATECGHLYHSECLHCWFRTQKKKLLNQGVTESYPDHCPTCQVEVRDDLIRRIYLLEDHREALEKAKFLEKMENLEIYCHQLEIHNEQLRQENDLLVNKALAPQGGVEEVATIVKNDRVMWLKKESEPLSGIVQSIFKKDECLWAKLKLDKKIRTNHRSGLFGSFRFDKNKEITVPFDDIVLERDFKPDNTGGERIPTSAMNRFPPQRIPSFRNSTTSLPGEYLLHRNIFGGSASGRMDNIVMLHNVPNNFRNSYGSSVELSVGPMSTGFDPGARPPVPLVEEHEPVDEPSSPENRDYVIFPATTNRQLKTNGKVEDDMRSSPQLDSKANKHVTFAADLLERQESLQGTPNPQGNHFRDHDYSNVIAMQGNFSEVMCSPMSISHQGTNGVNENPEIGKNIAEISPPMSSQNLVPSVSLTEPSTPSTPSTSDLSPLTQMKLQTDIFFESLDQSTKTNQDSEVSFNQTCFDITLTTLFKGCHVFDEFLLQTPEDNIQQLVHTILKYEFVNPIRDHKLQRYKLGYANRLYETISHLCSTCVDLEELMTILFEYVFKMPSFITYSYGMFDYIHQFFIDFTDKTKTPSVQHLFERSLALQDNLKLCGKPTPALLLQMPNSDSDRILHYDAVLPTLTLKIEQLLDEAIKQPVQECYCNKVATLECAACSKIHGKSPVLFCDECFVLLEAIHDKMHHKLELVAIPSATLELFGVICIKEGRYSAFLRDINATEGHVNWKFVERFENGKPQMNIIPNLEEWLKANSNTANLDISSLEDIQRKLLTECRMFLYTHVTHVKNSHA